MARRRADRIGLLFLGIVAGFALTVLALYLFVRSAQNRRISERVQVALGLPPEAFELERVHPDGALQIALRHLGGEPGAGELARALAGSDGSGGGHATMARCTLPVDVAKRRYGDALPQNLCAEIREHTA